MGNPISDSEGQKPTLLAEDDKALIRVKMIEALLAEHEKSIRDLLAETLHNIAIHDFPSNWPE